jgi:hypothetical protein
LIVARRQGPIVQGGSDPEDPRGRQISHYGKSSAIPVGDLLNEDVRDADDRVLLVCAAGCGDNGGTTGPGPVVAARVFARLDNMTCELGGPPSSIAAPLPRP